MQEIDRMLLIGSTAKKAGKTTLACQIIRNLNKLYKITTIKITPIEKADSFFLINQENNPKGSSDSSRFLAAGAEKAYWMQAEKSFFEEGFNQLLTTIATDAVIICESTSLRQYFKPGLFIIIRTGNSDGYKDSTKRLIEKADCIINTNGKNFDFDLNRIQFIDGKWSVK
jgi:Ni2+-binding GTPase involved in maturation of urease and hydrogenase